MVVSMGDGIPEDFLRAIFDAAAHLDAVGTHPGHLGREVALTIGRRRPEILAWFGEREMSGATAHETLEREGHAHGWWRMAHQWSGRAEGNGNQGDMANAG